MAAPSRRGETAPVAGLTTTSPAETQVGDLVLVFTFERLNASPSGGTLSLHSSMDALVRSHFHNDGSTDGAFAVAAKIATQAGAQSYQGFTSATGSPVAWTGCAVIEAGTFDTNLSNIVANSVSQTNTSVPDPPAVTLDNTRDWRVYAACAWHLSLSASFTPGTPTNYSNLVHIAGSANAELAFASRALTAPASEDPGPMSDSVTPNGTCSITVAVPSAVVGGGEQIVDLGQTTEASTAQPLARRKVKAVGQAAETGIAQALTRRKTRATGQPAETSAAQTLARRKAKAVGQPLETGAAQAISVPGNQNVALSQASETDAAQAIARRKVKATGQAAEAGTAQALTRRKAKALDQPAESGTSQAIARRKAKAVGQPLEASTAQAVKLSGPITVTLGTALETESAHVITNLIPFVAPAGGATRRQHLRFRRNGEVVLLTKKPVRSGAGRISASAGAETVLRARPLSSSAGEAFPQGSGEVAVRGLPPARASTRSRIRGHAGAEVVLRNRRRARMLAGRVTAVGFENPSERELMVLALSLSRQRRQARVRRILEALGVDA